MKWKPIEGAPNYVDILVAYSDGSYKVIDADDNDYTWKPYDKSLAVFKQPTHYAVIRAPQENEDKT